MDALSRTLARRPGRTIAAVLLVVVLSLFAASRLGLVTDLVALLPEGAEESTEYRRFLELFGGFEKVFVILVPQPGAPSEGRHGEERLWEAAEGLGEVLAASPEISEIRSGLEAEDEEFFKQFVVRRALLFLDGEALEAVTDRLEPAAVERRAVELGALLRSPTGALQAAFVRQDPLGFAADLPQLAGAGELPIDPVTGVFRSRDGDAALLILTPAGGELDPESGRRLLASLSEAFDEIEARWPGVQCRAIGGPLYAAMDETAIRADMEKTIAGSVLGCTAILLLAFGGFWIPTAAVLVLGAAFTMAGAALALGVHEMTAVALGFAAVLVGLGMDYVIHGATRFRQSRFAGAEPGEALATTFAEAGPGITTSALTTAMAFAILGVAHFRPLRELGLVVACGIVSIWLMTIFFGSALLVVRPDLPPPGRLWRWLDGAASGLVRGAERWPRTILGVAAIITLSAIWAVGSLRLEPDISAMRPANHPVFETERLLVQRFGLGIDTATLVIEASSLDVVLEQAVAVEEVLLSQAPEVSLVSPADWMRPRPAAAQRLESLQALELETSASVLEAALAKNNLSPAAFASGVEALRAFSEGRDPGAPRPQDWPAALAELLRKTPDGYAAALRVRLPDGLWASGPPEALLSRLRDVAPRLSVAAAPRLGQAMKRMASEDVRRLSGLGLALVALIVGLSFRFHPVACVLAMLPVVFGTLWTLGLWALLDRPLDLLSLSVVPILLGIGIDDGLHAVHGARAGRRFSMPQVPSSVRGAGLAMTLTTLTTCVGFGSLAFSSIPGLARGGLLVPIGVSACLLATLLVLPALAALAAQRRPSDGRGTAS